MYKVLIVDDEPRVLRFAELSLKRSGYEVISATSGEKAVELVESIRPDVVVLDILLPDMDGFEVLKKLRSFSDIPVIAFSARAGFADEVMRLGATDYLAKPFKPEELVRRIETLLPPSD